MVDTPGRLAERLAQDGQRSIDFLTGLTPEQWDCPVYSERTVWTPRQILAHFVSSEAANYQVVQDILHGGPGAPLDFDIDVFNQAQVSQEMDSSVQNLLGRFRQLRQKTVDLVGRMDLSDLQRSGRHPFFGETVLEEILKLIYVHNQIHLRDIRRKLLNDNQA